MPTIAILSFPGNNCEVESLRAIRNAGMEAKFYKWNDPIEKLKKENIDGYFIPGGFSYEDRGRAGMVAARDPVLAFLAEEAADGKVIIGNCNGAQVLIESGLVPLESGLRMSLARNVIDESATGFLAEWVWVTPTCSADRCATSNWGDVNAMHMPIAHGEGRFTTKDKDVIAELKKNDQLAFRYCDADGSVSEDPVVTPNGSMFAVACICNPTGNVVALMPHPERTTNGAAYFKSIKKWIEQGDVQRTSIGQIGSVADWQLPALATPTVEVFIDTLITNNEEKTVEQALRRVVPSSCLKQLAYYAPASGDIQEILSDLTFFNANKQTAFIRRDGVLTKWDADTKTETPMSADQINEGPMLLRVDEPDTGSLKLSKGGTTGVCYACGEYDEIVKNPKALEVLANPHASTLSVLPA